MWFLWKRQCSRTDRIWASVMKEQVPARIFDARWSAFLRLLPGASRFTMFFASFPSLGFFFLFIPGDAEDNFVVICEHRQYQVAEASFLRRVSQEKTPNGQR